jgi:hypothetical protein
MPGDAYETAIVAKLAIIEKRLTLLEVAIYGALYAKEQTNAGGAVTGVSLA